MSRCRDDGHGPYDLLSDKRVEEIARCVFYLRTSELEGTFMAREILAQREGRMGNKGNRDNKGVGQPQNESAFALVNLTLSGVYDARELLDHVRDRETGPRRENARDEIEITLRFAEIYLSALVQKLNAVEQICADGVRDSISAEEIYHCVRDVLHAARVITAAPSGQKESTDDSQEETE